MDNQLINLINAGVLAVLDSGIAKVSHYLPVNEDKTTINTVIVVTPGY